MATKAADMAQFEALLSTKNGAVVAQVNQGVQQMLTDMEKRLMAAIGELTTQVSVQNNKLKLLEDATRTTSKPKAPKPAVEGATIPAAVTTPETTAAKAPKQKYANLEQMFKGEYKSSKEFRDKWAPEILKVLPNYVKLCEDNKDLAKNKDTKPEKYLEDTAKFIIDTVKSAGGDNWKAFAKKLSDERTVVNKRYSDNAAAPAKDLVKDVK